MKSFIGIVKILGTVFLLAYLGSLVYSCASIPKLSKENKKTIKEVFKTPVPKIIKGETGFAKSDRNKIWYEKISPATPIKGTVLLIMGNGQDALAWPPSFVSNLTDQGYEVIRYDHRGTGLSISEAKWDRKNPYTLNDMSKDAIAILNTLNLKKAHIIGVSMGGMIAQIIALEHPERTKSLTSMMSSADVMDPELKPMSDEVLPKMISAVLKYGLFGNKKGQIKRQIVQKRILMGDATGEIDVKTMAEISFYNLKERDGYKLITARHHYRAILESEPRIEALRKLNISTLIIHGAQDPVMPIAHGKKLVSVIPNADSLWIDNMGHDLPDGEIQKMTDKIISNFEVANAD